MRLFIGTSGYSYKHWAGGVFYPPHLPQGKWFEFYASKFNSVELNVTFYRLPSRTAFLGWNRRAVRDFTFVLKGSRYITHLKRLKDAGESLGVFARAIRPLRSKISCILWQLPPHFKRHDERLSEFIGRLHGQAVLKAFDHVFELRHESWFSREVYRILNDSKMALCLADPAKVPFENEMITADFLYLRFHGDKKYALDYPDQALASWIDRISPRFKKIKRLYAFFNNDHRGYAPRNAIRFREMLSS